jgi:tetraacyldisaccharide 4'-kinase
VEIHEALVLCAIARPESFLDSVRAAGVEIRDSRIFPDHSPLDAGTLLDGISADVPIVVTAKDWVKLARRPDISGYRIVVARYSVHVEPAADFKIWLQERLGG